MGQMKKVLDLFKDEYNPIIMEKLIRDNYTKDAIHSLKLNLTKLTTTFAKMKYFPAFSAIQMRYVGKSHQLKNSLLFNDFAYKRYLKIKDGIMLEKYNKDSKGSHKAYVKIFDNKVLRWGKTQREVDSLKGHAKNLSEVQALFYGPVTDTFVKKNEKLNPWLCVSIIFKDRPYDVYLTEEAVNSFYLGLGYAIKKHNPNAFVLSSGKFLWRKLKLLLRTVVYNKMNPTARKNLKECLLFHQLVLYYGKGLPKKLQ